MESFSKCMPADSLLVTEEPQTSSWSVSKMEDLACQTIFINWEIYGKNAMFLWLFLDTVNVSCRHPSLLNFFLSVQIVLPLAQLLYGHSKDWTSGLCCMNAALGSSHILTSAVLRRHVRACSCFCICRSSHTDPSCIPLRRRSTLKQ